MEHTGGEVQITDRLGKISTAYQVTNEFLSGKVHFPPVSPTADESVDEFIARGVIAAKCKFTSWRQIFG